MNQDSSLRTASISPYTVAMFLIIGSFFFPLMSLTGWLTGARILASLGENFIPMAPSTASCFILIDFSLFLLIKRTENKQLFFLAVVISLIVSLFATLTFVGLSTGLFPTFDQIWFPKAGVLDETPIGNMAPSTAFLFILSGLSLLLNPDVLKNKKNRSIFNHLSSWFGLIVALSGLFLTLSYGFGKPLFYGTSTTPMALTTSISFTLLGVGLTFWSKLRDAQFDQQLSRIKDLRIAFQLQISFSVVLLFVMLLGMVSYQQSRELQQQTDTLYNHPLQVRRALATLDADILRMRLGTRNMMIASNQNEINEAIIEIEKSAASAHIQFQTIRERYLGPRSDVEEAYKAFIVWETARKKNNELAISGEINRIKESIKNTGDIGLLREDLLLRIKKIDNFSLNKADAKFKDSEVLLKALNGQLILLVVVIILLSLLINYILFRNIRNPLNELMRATKKFQEGDLSVRSSYSSKNEFGELSASFNKLADYLQENFSMNEKVASLSSLMIIENNVNTFFQRILSAIANHTGSQMAAVYLLSDDKKKFEHFFSLGVGEKARQSFDALSPEGEFGQAVTTRKIQLIETISEDTSFEFATVATSFKPKTIIVVPVVNSDEVIAVLSLASIGVYSSQSIQLIENILITLSSRIAGILAANKLKEFSERLEKQTIELAKANTYNRSLIEASVDPLVTIGPDGKITDVNSTTEKITGRSREELIGTDFSDYFTDPSHAKAGYQQVFREGSVRNYELAIRHSNGEITPVHYNASVYSDQEGNVIGVFAAARDITERKLAEKELNERSEKLAMLNMELEAQKNELSSQASELTMQNTELEIQKKQLDEASRLKTIFLSNMSHELRTPLNSVIALSGVLNRRLSTKIPEEEHGYLEVIERNGKHLLDLINDILDISRIEAGREEVEITTFNISAAISDVVNMIKPQAKLKNIELTCHTCNEKIEITSDSGKIRHILQNLIGNAVKFTEQGVVSIEAKQTDNSISITVADTGIGISEQNQLHIFDEFRQADSGTSRKYGGTGLGLAIAKKYVKFLGGDIFVKSKLGEGSIFTVVLPLKYLSVRVPEKETGYNLYSTPQAFSFQQEVNSIKTILLVEDSEPAIIQIKDIFDQSNFIILVAKDGLQALDIIGETTPDAMILDLMMPGIDGFEVLKIVRENPSTQHLPVLILTAKHITKEELNFLKSNHVHQLIQKGNINRNELFNAVTSMVFDDSAIEKQSLAVLPVIEGKPLVLVVEDNPDNLITVKAILSDSFLIIEAIDGNAGVEMAKKHRPDLILMDIQLPVLDGIGAFQAIRNDVHLQHIPIIALTASAMTSDRETILSYGFDAYITKPIDEQSFLKTIKEILYGN